MRFARWRRPNSGPVALAVVGTLAGGAAWSAILQALRGGTPRGSNWSLRTATSAEISDMIRRGEATIGLR